MIVDVDKTDRLPLAPRYDVCIAGGGVAGITLALRLAASKKRVLLLEAGGTDISEESQDVYQGKNVGNPYHDLDTARLRYLGGTSGHWSGQCRPLDAHDFLKRDHIPESGWPIRKADLDPYQDAAREILELDPFPKPFVLPDSEGKLEEIAFRWSTPVRLGTKYRKALADSKEIDVFLNANVVEAAVDTASGRIAHFGFRGYADGAAIQKAVADRFVLALGGIENARFLLAQGDSGLANETGMVGRYFMDHLTAVIGDYVIRPARGTRSRTDQWIIPTPALQKQRTMSNAGYRLAETTDTSTWPLMARLKLAGRRAACASDVVADWVRSVYPLRCTLPVEGSGWIAVEAEQVPNARSRVLLGDAKDRFGMPHAELDWQPTAFDRSSIYAGALEVAKYLARTDQGRGKLRDWFLRENDTSLTEFVGAFHHMGTTRMAAGAADGVVDRDCRVFGHENFFIAGSSVFRTGGQANPTFTIVQLALRLGDHLAAQA
jgi:choline dehydrogenase-like flavoprotein